MKENCITKLLNQAYQQWNIGDKFVRQSYDIYVNTLLRNVENKGTYLKYWDNLKNPRDDDVLLVNENIQRIGK